MSALNLAAALAVLLAATPVLAQETGGYPPGTSVADIERAERARTQQLNNDILQRDARTVAANQAEADRFAREQSAFEAAQRAHAEARARYEAEAAAAAAARAAYEADMAAWNAAYDRGPK